MSVDKGRLCWQVYVRRVENAPRDTQPELYVTSSSPGTQLGDELLDGTDSKF